MIIKVVAFAKTNEGKILTADSGTIQLRGRFDQNKCWDLSNWNHWISGYKRPIECSNLKIGLCSSDVAFFNPEEKLWYVADSLGWTKVNSIEEAKKHYESHLLPPPNPELCYT